MLCFLGYCYVIMCNLFYVRKNQNLWNLESCNLLLALFLQSLSLAWCSDVLEYPCCSLGLFQCSNLEKKLEENVKMDLTEVFML